MAFVVRRHNLYFANPSYRRKRRSTTSAPTATPAMKTLF